MTKVLGPLKFWTRRVGEPWKGTPCPLDGKTVP
eukprot:CAMPEP_0114280788 /NCGR_PEP_ID=MMETSP0059-20121206/2629_1 /TAXON_ID=36894 /ORGANISM="Pyramimonas parkeae, Strain CCMP726" /LENGTH=32 /DNA_ID= /DNA_START= /DNA_END= /DNA_ORIENTATION=